MILLISGVLGHYTYSAFSLVLKSLGILFIYPSELNIILTYSAYGVIGLFFGCLFSTKEFRYILKENSEIFIIDDKQATTGFLEKDLVEAINNESTPFILELSNGKFYIGLITEADIQDDMPTEEKVIKFYPLISGYRSRTDGKVTYNVSYLSDEQSEELAPLNGDDFSKKLKEFLSKIPPIAIFQKHLLTYRKFDLGLQARFHPGAPEDSEED